ncbi:MAG TPA: molecular chaperone TorD family protein [Acidobacteriota bacterium]|nr:molecular chaperone TorD family protein [Acidobacteriota bacterium]HNH84119.1 molecular chaperone TorD family protein [Acidobacteriota bacterium]
MTKPKYALDPKLAQLFQEASDWRLLSLLFECPRRHWQREITKLAAQTTDPDLKEAAQAALQQASEGLYHSTFGPGGPVPGREISYHTMAQPGYLLSEVACYYAAFGYQPDSRESPDHIAIEIGFFSYLRLKEAFALAAKDAEAAQITTETAEHFMTEHLSVFGGQFSQSLVASEIPYLVAAGRSLLRRVGPRKSLPLYPASPTQPFQQDEECGFACGE